MVVGVGGVENGTKKSSKLPNVTQLVSGRIGFGPRQSGSLNSCAFLPLQLNRFNRKSLCIFPCFKSLCFWLIKKIHYQAVIESSDTPCVYSVLFLSTPLTLVFLTNLFCLFTTHFFFLNKFSIISFPTLDFFNSVF